MLISWRPFESVLCLGEGERGVEETLELEEEESEVEEEMESNEEVDRALFSNAFDGRMSSPIICRYITESLEAM